MKYIYLQGKNGAGKKAIVDAQDYDKQNQYKWYWNGNYAHRIDYLGTVNGKRVIRSAYLHRDIMSPPKGLVVDHINGNPLDNRRANLRICTQNQNMANMGKGSKSNPYKGVVKSGKSWYAKISASGKKSQSHYFGPYASAEDAAVVRDSIAYQIHGEYAYMNFRA